MRAGSLIRLARVLRKARQNAAALEGEDAPEAPVTLAARVEAVWDEWERDAVTRAGQGLLRLRWRVAP